MGRISQRNWTRNLKNETIRRQSLQLCIRKRSSKLRRVFFPDVQRYMSENTPIALLIATRPQLHRPHARMLFNMAAEVAEDRAPMDVEDTQFRHDATEFESLLLAGMGGVTVE